MSPPALLRVTDAEVRAVLETKPLIVRTPDRYWADVARNQAEARAWAERSHPVKQIAGTPRVSWPSDIDCPLTVRQRRVLAGAACGWSDEEIGRDLGMPGARARRHRRNAYKRLGVDPDAESPLEALRSWNRWWNQRQMTRPHPPPARAVEASRSLAAAERADGQDS